MDFEIKEKLNIYVCDYGCHNITVDVDKGVTPFMIPCRRRGDEKRPLDPNKSKDGVCIGTAKSAMYPRTINNVTEIPTPLSEWYKPNEAEIKTLSEGELDHVNQGGLLIRDRTDKEALLH